MATKGRQKVKATKPRVRKPKETREELLTRQDSLQGQVDLNDGKYNEIDDLFADVLDNCRNAIIKIRDKTLKDLEKRKERALKELEKIDYKLEKLKEEEEDEEASPAPAFPSMVASSNEDEDEDEDEGEPDETDKDEDDEDDED